MRVKRIALPVLSVLFLAGCATTVPDLDRERLEGDLMAYGVTLSEEELPKPRGELELESAIHQALLRNPRMQAAYARLDLEAADVIEASQFANPSLSLSVLRPEGGGGNEYGIGLAWGISGWLLRSARIDIAESHWESTRLQLTEGMVALASDTERAWYEAVAARQQAQVQALETRAADLGLRLGQRFHEAGNITDLDKAHLRIRATESRLQLEEARRQERATRLNLAHLMGIPGEIEDWSVPATLPLPLADPDAPGALVDQALDGRLDLAALDKALDGMTEGVALVRRYRWLGDIEPGIEFERETDGTRLWGGGITFTLPLFNRNQSGVHRAEARLREGEARRDRLTDAIIADVHEQHYRLLHHRERFRMMREELLPAREIAMAGIQERVNYMFDDVFDLLEHKQEELRDWRRTVAELGDYWRARADLAYAVAGPLPGGPAGREGYFDTGQLEREPGQMHHHHDHGHDHEDHGEPHDHEHGDHTEHSGHGGHH